jgi:hypothetical protein
MDLQTAKRLFVWGSACVDRETTGTPEEEQLRELAREILTESFVISEDGLTICDAEQRIVERILDTPADDDNLDPWAILDEMTEHLWGCFDIIDAPASVLDAIGVDVGATYHDAVLYSAVSWLSEYGGMFGIRAKTGHNG